jgi:hypothetical protein
MSTTADSKKPISIGIRDAKPLRISPEFGLSAFVVFTSLDWTLKALEKAREIAEPVEANIVVAAVQVVPFPLPLDRPPVPMEFLVRRFEEKANEFPEGTQIQVYLCRNPMEAFKRILKPNCPVVIGLRKRWWPTRYGRLARKLRRAGYDVILAETE